MPEPTIDSRSVPELIADLAGNLSTLVRKEIELARAEASEKLKQLRSAAMEALVGALLLVFGVFFVLQAITLALADALGLVWASVVVGAVLCLAGGAAFLFARRTAPDRLKLERSAAQLHETAQVAGEQAP